MFSSYIERGERFKEAVAALEVACMSRSINLPVYRGDPLLLILGLALISVGLVAIASASIEYSDFHFGNPWHHTQRHALYLMAGFAAGGLAYCLPTDTLQRLSPWLLFVAFALLILVLMPGIGPRSARRSALAPSRATHLAAVRVRKAGFVALRRGLPRAPGRGR
jgi:hypothetical protein